jgi:hypothetical protein
MLEEGGLILLLRDMPSLPQHHAFSQTETRTCNAIGRIQMSLIERAIAVGSKREERNVPDREVF